MASITRSPSFFVPFVQTACFFPVCIEEMSSDWRKDAMKQDERAKQTKSNLTNLENRVSNVTPPILITPLELASRLNVSEKTAIRVMKELPHINVSMDMYSGKQRIRITEKTYADFANGLITRKRLRRGG